MWGGYQSWSLGQKLVCAIMGLHHTAITSDKSSVSLLPPPTLAPPSTSKRNQSANTRGPPPLFPRRHQSAPKAKAQQSATDPTASACLFSQVRAFTLGERRAGGGGGVRQGGGGKAAEVRQEDERGDGVRMGVWVCGGGLGGVCRGMESGNGVGLVKSSPSLSGSNTSGSKA